MSDKESGGGPENDVGDVAGELISGSYVMELLLRKWILGEEIDGLLDLRPLAVLLLTWVGLSSALVGILVLAGVK